MTPRAAASIEYASSFSPYFEDLDQAVFRVEGCERITVAEDNSLLIETACGPLHQSPPRTWYELPSGER